MLENKQGKEHDDYSQNPKEKIPFLALVLTIFNVLPFLVIAFIQVFLFPDNPYPQMTRWILIYGACILSFFGGIRWGYAMSSISYQYQQSMMIMGTIPMLLGWLVTILLPYQIAFGVMALLFAAIGTWDSWPEGRLGVPVWYKKLRFMATFPLVLCWLIITLFS